MEERRKRRGREAQDWDELVLHPGRPGPFISHTGPQLHPRGKVQRKPLLIWGKREKMRGERGEDPAGKILRRKTQNTGPPRRNDNSENTMRGTIGQPR